MTRFKILFDKFLKGLIFFFGVLFLLFVMVNCAREGTKMVTYHQQGSLESGLFCSPDSILFFSRIEASEFPSPPVPIPTDTLIAFADTTLNCTWIMQEFGKPVEPDLDYTIVFVHEGDTLQSVIRATRPTTSAFVQLLILQITRFLLVLSFLGVGFWAFIKRPDSAGVRTLALFCFGMAGFFTFAVSALSSRFATFEIPLADVIATILRLVTANLGAFWINLQLIFPRPKRFIQNHPVWAYSLCYAPLTIILIISLLGFDLPSTTPFIIFSLQLTIGFIILGFSYVRTREGIEKRQVALVLWGTGIGLVMLLLLLAIAFIFSAWLTALQWNVLFITFFFIPILLSPLSFLYAFGRYRLLEVEAKLRRGTRYATITILMLAVSIGIVYLIGELLMRQFGISDRTPTFIVALGLALGFTPAWRRVHAVMERRFFPERHHLRMMIREFLKEIISIADRNTLWQQIKNQLQQAFGIKNVYPILKNDEDIFLLDTLEGWEKTPFRRGQETTERLRLSNYPLLVDEAIASGKVAMSPESYNWLKTRQIALLLPMVLQSELVGFLALGLKHDSEDFAAEDLQILASLSSQVALASENIRLLEENIVKKRMEEELQFAHRIQRGFLPAEIPETPGLDIAAESLSCLEVAGDYYDVIALPEGKTVLAIGDVSGKGAGAALIMANLQASLRTAVGIGASLTDLVARINDLIYQNTPQEQYITFVVALFDAKERTLTYVNAGHNPPVLVRVDGETQTLDKGGLILGCMPGMPYEQETLSLHPDDCFMMFTDGISEAMNEKGDEFGEDRILKILTQCHTLAPHEILNHLKDEARFFTGDAPWQDDLTLVLGKIL
jgi:sigma-B regulation protein RsbU (phosphoserine phosphatase)